MEADMATILTTATRHGVTFPAAAGVAESGGLDSRIAMERIGTRHSFRRDEEIYADGDTADCWFKVVSGVVRLCKFLADGRRHIAAFYFAADCFGFETTAERVLSAEAVGDAVVMRYPRRATERLIDESPALTRDFRQITLRGLAAAQSHMLLLGRMTAAERVATFLLDIAERRDAVRAIDLPMSRSDIADYLGLTIETVCRVLSAFKRAGAIAIPQPHRIEFRDRIVLQDACDA
jgi:CRP/FNR family transcriptional regulator, nitrogen fixation regulation protein